MVLLLGLLYTCLVAQFSMILDKYAVGALGRREKVCDDDEGDFAVENLDGCIRADSGGIV